MRCLLLCFAALCLAQDITVYVSPTGSGLICDEMNPCHSIKQAYQVAKTKGAPPVGFTTVIEVAAGAYQLTQDEMNVDIEMSLTIAGPSNDRPVFLMPAPDNSKPTGNYLFSIGATSDVSVDNLMFYGADAPSGDLNVTTPTAVVVNQGVLEMHSCAIEGALAHGSKFAYPLYGVIVGGVWPSCALLDCTSTPLTTATVSTLKDVMFETASGGVFLSAGLASAQQTLNVESCGFRSMHFVRHLKSVFGVAIYGGFPLTFKMSDSVIEVNQYPIEESGTPEAVIRVNSLVHCNPDCSANKNKRVVQFESLHFAKNTESPTLLALKGPVTLQANEIYFENNSGHDQVDAMIVFESISDTIWNTGIISSNNYPVGVLISGKWISEGGDIAGLLVLNLMTFTDNTGLCVQSLTNCFLFEASSSTFNQCSRGAVVLQGSQCSYPDPTKHIMKIANTRFIKNGDADQYGGGVSSLGAYGSLNFASVEFEENQALLGAAIYAASSSESSGIGGVRLSHCSFTKNTARASPYLVAAEGIPIFVSDRSSATGNIGCTATHAAQCPAVSCDEIRYGTPTSQDAGQLLSCQDFAATHGGYVAAVIIICIVGVGVVFLSLFRYIKTYDGPRMITTPPDFNDEGGSVFGSETSRLTDNL